MTEEEAFRAAIESDPLDRLNRLVFADWLDEHDDPRAEGFRVLATFDRWPWEYKQGGFVWSNNTVRPHVDSTGRLPADHGEDRSQLPPPWLAAIKRFEEERTRKRILGFPRHLYPEARYGRRLSGMERVDRRRADRVPGGPPTLRPRLIAHFLQHVASSG